jgi:hypothetical protein
MKNRITNYLIGALFLISLGGFGLHFAIHNPGKDLFGYVPFIAGLISVIAVPLLFKFKKTIHLAYILNGFIVIIGIITMVNFSISEKPIIPDIMILLGKFYLGRAIFCLEVFNLESDPHPAGWNLIKYPNMGFWYVHLVLLSAVYFLGHYFWR